MQTPFGNFFCFDFFSHVERACLFARGRFIDFSTKRCFLSSISAVLKRDFQDVHPKNLLQLSEYVDITYSCQGKSLNFSHYVAPIKPRSHRSSGAF